MKNIKFYFKRKRDEEDLADANSINEVSSQYSPEAENNFDEPTLTTAVTSTSTEASRGRTYTFNVNWLNIFPWLDFENNLMFCKYCRGQKQAGNSLFVSGNPHLKKDSVTKHNISRRHIQCRDLYLLRQEKPSSTVSAALKRQVLLSEEEKRRQLKIKMNIAYFIAKEEEPFVKFGPLIRLHHKNGVNINPTYDNDVRCAEMIGQISDIMRESLSAKLKAAKYLAVLIDGDTDISNTECEIVYVRLLEDGKPVNLLVGQQTLEHSHAIGVLDATKAAFCAVCPEEDGGSWMKKCISFGADGASVNMGHRGGVIAHLQREAGRHIIPIHCMPHRLELAILTVQKKEPKVAVVYDLLHLIWKTYHFSGKSKRELYGLGQELGVDICTPASVKGTRWIPHVHRALKVFLRHGQEDLATDQGQYSVVLQHMEHLAVASTTADVQGRAKKIKREMENALFCVFCHFLSDMFEELSSLSLTLQRNDLILPQATSELRKTVTRLEALKFRAKAGGMLEKIQTMLAQQQGDERRFQGITLKGNLKGFTDLTNPQLRQHMEAAINIAVGDLKARFGGLLKDESAQTPVESFKVLNPDTWPEDQASLLTFGDDDVADLVRHFKEPLERSGCNLAAIQDEWQGLKTLVSHNFKDKSYSGLWETMLTKDPYRLDYKNILEVVQIMLVLPISAAQCERGFSAQNRIKTSTRSCLGVSTTEDLMRISLEGPSVEEFDPTPAVNRWLTSKRSRRPTYKSSWTTDILCI